MVDVRDVRSKMFVIVVDLTFFILLIIRRKQLLGQQPRPRPIEYQLVVLFNIVQAATCLLDLGRLLDVLLDDFRGSVRSLYWEHLVLLVGVGAAAGVVEGADDAVRQDVVGVLVLLEEGCHLVDI